MSNTNQQHERFFVSLGAAIYDAQTKRFLVLKDADETGDYATKFGPWELPGGRMNQGETAVEALNREIFEETGLTETEVVGVIDAALSPQPYHGVAGFLVTYLAYYRQGDIRVSDEHSAYAWVTAEEIEQGPEYKEWFKERIRKAVKYLQVKS